jgi:hypothetical protein
MIFPLDAFISLHRIGGNQVKEILVWLLLHAHILGVTSQRLIDRCDPYTVVLILQGIHLAVFWETQCVDKGSRIKSGTQNWSYVFKVRPSFSSHQAIVSKSTMTAMIWLYLGHELEAASTADIRVDMYQVSLDLT